MDTVEDGLAAVDGTRSNPPDLMVLDLMLPVMDGIEVCRRVRLPTTNSMMHVWTVAGAPQQFGDLDEAWKRNYLDSLGA